MRTIVALHLYVSMRRMMLLISSSFKESDAFNLLSMLYYFAFPSCFSHIYQYVFICLYLVNKMLNYELYILFRFQYLRNKSISWSLKTQYENFTTDSTLLLVEEIMLKAFIITPFVVWTVTCLFLYYNLVVHLLAPPLILILIKTHKYS